MRLSERSYPHPVVGNRDDVPGAAFQAVKQAFADKEYFYIDIDVSCSSETICDLVRRKQAAYVAHIECTNTMYRDIVRFHDQKFRIQIPITKLFDRFEVNVFACVLGSVSSYRVSGAHADYGDAAFDLSEGDIIAVADGEDFFVEAEDSLARVGSIMVVEESSKDGVPMVVNCLGERISIILSKRDFAAYRATKGHEHLGSTLTSTIVLPALMYVLGLMKANPDDAQYAELRWHTNLSRRLEKMGVARKDYDPLEVAQQLLDQPIRRALSAGSAIVEMTA